LPDDLNVSVSLEEVCALFDAEVGSEACKDALRGPEGPRGPKGADGKDGKAGKNGVSGYHVRNVTIGVDDGYFRGLDHGEQATFTVYCDKGAVALGGGVTP